MSYVGAKHAFLRAVRRRFSIVLVLLSGVACLRGATLERLSFEEMAARATSIVRGRVTGSRAAFSGPVIYTHFQVQVGERLKGSGPGSVEVLVPGGVANNLRQTFAGTPEIRTGEEYVFFLWTGRDGKTQVMGLTQGVFSLAKEQPADPMATRAASRELMLDRSTGRPVKDQTLVMRMSELRTKVGGALGAKGK